jgi:hypothetical protein
MPRKRVPSEVGECLNEDSASSHLTNDSVSSRKIYLTTKTLRRVLNFKEHLMKYGVFIPRNDREADASPEALRWDSGRQLEWLRLRD